MTTETASRPSDPTLEVAGSIAVVTGGAGGIGSAIAARLAGEGARVAVIDLNEDRAIEAAAALPAPGGPGTPAAGDGHIGLGADVGDAASLHAALACVEQRLGPIDLYFSNAGIASGAGLGDPGAWEASWKVHVMAHVHAAELVLPGMRSRGRGAFVVTASAAGLLMMMQSAPYTVTKHASVAVTEWLAVNYGGDGVQFHCLCPQGVLTPMVTGGDGVTTSELQAAGNLLQPEAVAEAVMDALALNQFLILPHPEVHGYEEAKVADRDRWLAGMRRLLTRVKSAR